MNSTVSTIDRPAAPKSSTPRITLLVLAGVAASAIATTVISLAAGALGANPGFMPLQPALYLSFATAGTLAAIAGWTLVVRFVRRSARVLRVAVPVLVALSLIPDVVLLLTGFIPGSNVAGVVGLMLMHPTVAAVAVLVGSRIAPAR